MEFILSIKEQNKNITIRLLNKQNNLIVFNRILPVYYEFEGHLIEDDSFIETSNINDFKNYFQIKKYLVSIGIISDNDVLLMDEEEKIKFENGGSIPYVKKQLEKKVKETNDGLYLPYEISIYVPTTENKNEKISKEKIDKRISEVSIFLSETFGGFTKQNAEGGYQSLNGEIITEDVIKITSFASKKNMKDEAFLISFKKLVNKCKEWCKEWSQEAIGFEFEGDMVYITEDLTFKNGGFLNEKEYKHSFDYDVKKISENIIKKPVPKKYQKEYGKTYNKKEALLAAKRIKGTLIKKKK